MNNIIFIYAISALLVANALYELGIIKWLTGLFH